MVLLKNENVLPLNPSENVVFIGGFAKRPRYQGGGSSHINSFRVDSALKAVKDIAEVSYAEGFSSSKDLYDKELAADAVEAARRADKRLRSCPEAEDG